MKKKIFTLLTLALCVCSGAWADTELISYSVTASSLNTTTDKTWTDNDASGTPGGTCSFYYRSTKSAIVTYEDVKYYQLGGGDASIKLTLSGANTFKTGDVVSVTYYGSTTNATGYYVRKTYKGSSNQIASETTSSQNTVYTKTVSLDANFNGESTIYIERYSPTMCISSVSVSRPVTYSVSVSYNGEGTYGTASAVLDALAEGKTTVITAVPASGYKVTNWAVSGTGASISPSGASNSLTTTLTMGTANATVTCTFAAAATYTISYGAGSADGVTGSKADETKTEDVNFTLPSKPVFTRTGYLQTGWNTNADGTSGTHYEFGATYTANAAQTFYPEWTLCYYSFVAGASSGDIAENAEVNTSTGGKMIYTPLGSGGTLKYASNVGVNGIEFGGGGNCAVTVLLGNKIQAGSVITFNMYVGSASSRGLIIAKADGTNVATFSESVIGSYTKSYTVTAGDGIAGTNSFKLKRNNNAYLECLYVMNCGASTETIEPSKEYTTYCSPYALDFSGIEGLTAYVVDDAADGDAHLTAVTSVPAGTGLILRKTSGSSFDVPLGTAISLGTTNKMVGVTKATAVAAWADGTVFNYILSDGAFYRAEAGTLAAGKAYLHLDSNPESAGAPSLMLDFGEGETTGINMVQGSEYTVNGEYYDLQGRRVAQPTKGLYIVNGKKVVVK